MLEHASQPTMCSCMHLHHKQSKYSERVQADNVNTRRSDDENKRLSNDLPLRLDFHGSHQARNLEKADTCKFSALSV